MKAPRKRAPRPAPRRAYLSPEKMRAAFLAGEGRTGSEIADILGGTSAQKVRAMLRAYGLSMRRNAGFGDLFPLICLRRDVRALRSVADDLDIDANELLLLILRDALSKSADGLRDIISTIDPEFSE